MKKKSASQSAFFNLRVLIGLFVVVAGVFQALFATSGAGLSFGSRTAGSVQIKAPERPVNPISPRGGVQEEWVARYNGGYGPDVADAIAVDGSGNVYVTGSSFGPGTCNLACVDYATIKYDSSGTQQWAARYNGPASDSDQASAIAVDASGNVYVTGSSIGTTWPDYDYATIKYDSSGQQQWVARYSGPGNDLDFGNAIAVDASGNVYVTGASFGSGTGFDYATVKYDSSGQQQWVGRYNGPANDDDEAHAITIDGSGNVYVTGYSVGSGTQEDYATIKYDASGTEEWVARYNGQANFNDDAAAIAVDASGNVYVAGWSVGSGSGYDYATVKYDSSGAEQWIARYDGAASVDDQSYAIAVDDSGDVCVTGYSTVDAKTGLTDYTTIKYSQSSSPTPTPTGSPSATPTATPRATPTPRARPTPAARPSPRQ